MENDGSDQRTKICPQCRRFDFDQILSDPAVIDCRDGIPILELQDFSKFPNCPLCCLFKSVAYEKRRWNENGEKSERYHLRSLDSFTANGLKRSNNKLSNQRRTFLSVYPGGLSKQGNLPKRPESWTPFECGYNGFIASSKDKPNLASIDYQTLRNYIQTCGDEHKDSCLATSAPPSGLRVWDCQDNTLVPRQTNDYIALSYLWGKSKDENESAHQQKHGAKPKDLGIGLKKLPLTIADAVEFTKNLGYRYFWNDQICIDQNDPIDLETQIRMMGSIYEHAVATIVDLSGHDCEAGLPGVSSVPRSQHPSVLVGDRYLFSTLPHVSYFIDPSKWATRGWTYQEAMLSRRCLFVTNAQVYFVCRSKSCSELVPDGMEFPAERTPHPLFSLGPSILSRWSYQGSDTRSSVFVQHRLMRDFAEFTKRKFTFQKDAINGFRGFLSKFVPTYFFGIPVFASDDSERSISLPGFLIGLFWSHRSYVPIKCEVSRRKGFPTWAWASLDTHLGYDLIGKDDYLVKRGSESLYRAPRFKPQLEVAVEVEDESGTMLPIQSVLRATTVVPELPSFKTLYIEADILSIESIEYGRESDDAHHLKLRFARAYDDCDSAVAGAKLYIDESISGGNDHLSQLVSGTIPQQQWWAVGLLRGVDNFGFSVFHFLMVEWDGQTAKRIGAGTDFLGDYERIPRERKRFPLV